MRRLTQILGATALISVVAACGTTTPRTAEPTPSTAKPGGAAGGAPVATQAPPNTSPPVKPRPVDPATFTIHPDHIGALKIGMSLAAAKATGLIVIEGHAPYAEPCIGAHWKGQPDDVWMVFNGKYGLRALDSYGNQKTSEGITTGSTLSAVRHAYPNLTWREDGDGIPNAKRTDGDVLVDAVKGDGAHYRISIQKGKVTDVQLESDRTGCYE